MTWLEQADALTRAADKARLAGDPGASIALAIVAAQCLEIARNLDQAERLLGSPTGGDG